MSQGVATVVMVLLVEASLVSLASSQRVALGRCPAPPAENEFQFDEYAGEWFQTQRYAHALEFQTSCVSVVYVLRDDDTSYDTITRYAGRLTGSITSFSGRLTCVDPARDQGIFVQSHGFIPRFQTSDRLDGENYRVLAVNYDDFAIVFNCREFGFFNIQYLWVLTRARNPDADLVLEIRSIILSLGLSVDDLRTTPQVGCDE